MRCRRDVSPTVFQSDKVRWPCLVTLPVNLGPCLSGTKCAQIVILSFAVSQNKKFPTLSRPVGLSLDKDILICSSFDSIDSFLLYVVLFEVFAAIH